MAGTVAVEAGIVVAEAGRIVVVVVEAVGIVVVVVETGASVALAAVDYLSTNMSLSASAKNPIRVYLPVLEPPKKLLKAFVIPEKRPPF